MEFALETPQVQVRVLALCVKVKECFLTVTYDQFIFKYNLIAMKKTLK